MKLNFIFVSTFLIIFNLSQLSAKITLELIGLENVKDQKTGQLVPTAYVGRTFILKVTISGSGKFDGLEVLGLENFQTQPTGQSERDFSDNSRVIKVINITFDVYADKEGTFTLGPARVKENGTRINSEPEKITFNITKEPAGRVVKRESGRYEREGSDPQGYELFCKSKVDRANVVIGEPIVYTASIFTRGNLAIAGINHPGFSGFLSKEISQVVQREEVVDGKKYRVLDKKCLLLPTQAGDLHISPLEVYFNIPIKVKQYRGNPFEEVLLNVFGQRYETKRVASQEVLLKVNPLPPYSGKVDGVGSFTSFKVEVDKKQAVINEPILLSVEIFGKGNLDQIVSPKLNLPDFFTTYESKTDVQQDLSQDFIGGKKRFEFVLQVAKEGDWDLPEQSFTYFDVTSRSYKTFKSAPIKLKINLPPQGQQTSVVAPVLPTAAKTDEQGSKPVIKYKKDINFIEENFSPEVKKTGGKIPLWLFLFLLFLPIFFSKKIIAFLGISSLKNRLKGRYGSKRALGKFKNDLDNIIKSGQVLKIYPLFLAYFAFKFSALVSEITEDLIEKKLIEAGWQHQKISDFLFYLNQCASLSFASNAKRDFDAQKFLEKSKYWFFMLESKSE